MLGTLIASVRMERTYKAPPERVFDAWLDPATVAKWMAPGQIAASAKIDPQVGGHYQVFHSVAGRSVGGFDARIVELDRANRIGLDWGFWGPELDRGPRYDSRLAISFYPIPSGTRLLLVHDKLEDLNAALPEVAAHVDVGWQDVLATLAMVIE